MSKTLSLLICCLFLTVSYQANAQYNHKNLKLKRKAAFNDDAFGKRTKENPEEYETKFTYENLRIFPIIASAAFIELNRDIGKFTLLKDAIEEEKIIITETGAEDLADDSRRGRRNRNGRGRNGRRGGGVDGTVNTLFAKNVSQDTIFIMAGEVVKGGKQDRVIAEDVVLAPGEKVNLSAFCVERSRWSTKNGNKGKFTGYYNVSSTDIRKVVATDKDQSKVWSTVAEHTDANGADSDTKTYTNLENSKEYQEKVEKYLETFQNAFADDSTIIGVIAVSGDKVIGLDVFATNDLFADSYENLIHSYVGTAITKGSEVTITNDEVYAYLDDILKDEEKQDEKIKSSGSVFTFGSRKMHMCKF